MLRYNLSVVVPPTAFKTTMKIKHSCKPSKVEMPVHIVLRRAVENRKIYTRSERILHHAFENDWFIDLHWSAKCG